MEVVSRSGGAQHLRLGQKALRGRGRGLGELPGDNLFGLQATLFEAGTRSALPTK